MFTVRRLAARLALIAPLAALPVAACEQEPPTIGFLATIEVNRDPRASTVTASGQPVAAEAGTDSIPLGMAPETER